MRTALLILGSVATLLFVAAVVAALVAAIFGWHRDVK